MQARVVYIVALLLVAGMPLLLLGQLQAGYKHSRVLPPAMPKDVVVLDKALLEQVLAQNIWDKGRASAPLSETGHIAAHEGEAQADLRWVLLAVSRLGDGGMAVIRHGNDILRVWSGDTLPDGAVMSRVLHNGIEYESDGKMLQLYLFGKNNSQQKSDDK